jgi:membrane protein YqaA with SNARE-associated domain
MAAIALAYRARRSPALWVLAATLAPALICTLLARIVYPNWWHLVGYFWYSIPANTFVYLPHEPAVVYAGAIYSPWVVAVVGGLSTVVASIIDYFVVKRVFEFRRVAPVKQTELYKTAVRYFYWRPWETIVFFAFSPLPYYPIRILAPSSGYPLWRYVSANVTGRVPRYFLIALGAAWMPVPQKYLFLMAALLFAVSFLLVFWGWRKGRSH